MDKASSYSADPLPVQKPPNVNNFPPTATHTGDGGQQKNNAKAANDQMEDFAEEKKNKFGCLFECFCFNKN